MAARVSVAASPDTDRRLTAEWLRGLLAVINSSRGLNEILSYLVAQAQAVLGCDGVALYLRDPDDPTLLEVQAVHGLPADVVNPTALVGEPLIGLAVDRCRSVVVSDVPAVFAGPPAAMVDEQIVDRDSHLEVIRPGPQSLDPEIRARSERFARGYRTVASVPMIARDDAYGALVLCYRAANAYGAAQVDLSQTFAQQAALAIENARLRAQADQRLNEIERRQRVAEALRDLLAIVNSSHDLDEILAEVLAQSSRLLGSQGSAVYVRDTDAPDMLRVRAALGFTHEQLAVALRVGSPTTGLAVQQGRTLVCQDLAAALDYTLTASTCTELEEAGTFARVTRLGAQTDPDLETGLNEPRVGRLVSRFRAVIATPLVARGRVFGAISLFYPEPRQFSAEDVDLARTFAEQATLAIENARLHAEADSRMRENERRRRVAEAMRDLLASVNSTRSLDEVLDLVLAQASEFLGADAGSVLLLDEDRGEGELLTVRASRALVSDIVPARLPVGTAITGVAVERGRPVAVSDLLQALPVQGMSEPLMEERPGYLMMRRVGTPAKAVIDALDLPRVREIARYYRALLAVPLMVRSRMHGAITLYYRRPREFSHEEVGLAEAFADQTALAMENARLHGQTLRRSRELEALYRADEMLYASLRLDEVLQALVDVAADVLEADMTSVLVWDEAHEHLVPGATRGFRPEVVAQMSHAPGEGITTRVALSGQPIAVADAATDPRVAHRITDAEGIKSLLHVPIKVNGEVFGVFGVNYRQQRVLAGEEERVLLALAHRAAVAIENARLYTDSEARRHELEALYRADETLHSSLRLDDVLRALVDIAVDVVHADKSSVHVLDEDHRVLVTHAQRGYSDATSRITLRLGEDLVLDDELAPTLVVVYDATNDPRISSGRAHEIVENEGVRSGVAAPIVVAGKPFGLFSIAFCTPHAPTLEEQRLVHALAQRAGLAIHNARLFEQAQQVATAEERQRLARELHDAVTQTLFSASLIAEVVPRLFERDPEQARQRLEELRRLTRGALAEMRTLLLELRPTALSETPLAQLLRQLAEATATRANLKIDVRAADADTSLAPEVQLALYRVAQEALNNTVKHAGAQCAGIHLRRRPARIDLHLIDDGRGFDPATTIPGHLGLGIMHERARGIGARLRIESRAGGGTRVHVQWRSR